MLYSQFVKALKKMNPKLVFRPGRNRASGLYLKQDGHVDADEKMGLLHQFGIPSPNLFHTLPRENFYDEFGNWHRGLKTVARLLVDKHLVRYSDAKKYLGQWVFMGKQGCEFNAVVQNNKREEAKQRLFKEFERYTKLHVYGGI